MKKKSLSINIVVIVLALTFSKSFCQTNINSNIFSDTHWTVAGSPYIINYNIVVFENVTLFIDPGVVVKFNNNLGMEIRGKLYAVGNETDSITFTSNSATPSIGIWKGLIFSGTTDPLGVGNQGTLEYCKGMYADTFLDMDIAYHGPYNYIHCFFYKNNRVSYDGGMPRTYFTDCTFYENATGLTHNQFTLEQSPDYGGFAKKCIFINNVNAVDGFENIDSSYFSGNTGVALSPYGSAKNCIVENNNTGVQCLFNGVNKTFVNNYIHDNSIGVWAESFFNGVVSFSKNQICNNLQYNFKYTYPNNANISNNCWCSSDSATIRTGIYDGYAPGSTSGLVTFFPLASACNKPDLFIQHLCINSDAILKSVIPGNTYQWQINSGNGFVNLSDNNSYSGVNTSALQISNIPSSYSGNLYRCIVDGNVYTPPSLIRFLNTWVGTIDSAWENPDNWSCGSIPDSNTDVVISYGAVVLNSNGICRSITVYSPGNYTVNSGFDLTITH